MTQEQPSAPATDRGKLAILAPYTFVPANSGGQRAILGYVRYLSKQWPTVCITTDDNELFPEVEMVPLFTNHPSKYIDPRVGWRIRRYLQQEKIAFLGLQHHYFGLLLRPFLIGLNIKVFVCSHNLEFERWRTIGKWWWPLMKWTERYVYRWADAVFFISWQEAQEAPAIFGLPKTKCLHAPYAVERPPSIDVAPIRAEIKNAIGATTDEKLLLFFGPQSYAPNREAVLAIVQKIHPVLKEKATFKYRILICGGGLSAEDAFIKDLAHEGIHYLGFVPKIEDYVLACDVVLNPVNTGGGVKTKLVEAVALGKTVVSTETGARGVESGTYGSKLVQVPDTDWVAFAETTMAALEDAEGPVPAAFWTKHTGPASVQPIFDWLCESDCSS